MTGGDVDGNSIVDGVDLFRGKPVRLRLANGRVASVSDGGDASEGLLVAPGLVDIQVNGAGGMDFQADNLSAGTVAQIARILCRNGVTTFLPTLITNDVARISRSIRIIAGAADHGGPDDGARIGGIHLEGPFISPEDGPRGAHQREFVRAPAWELLKRWQDDASGMIRIITLSPEWPGATDFIERCVDSGVVVAIGHTAATPEQVRSAIDAGARLSTHLGNGAHTVLPRHHNYVWEQLASDELWASLIADGAHLPDAVLRVMIRAKGDRAILVSDIAGLAGMEPGDYETPTGRQVRLTDDGRLVLRSNPALLAGSVRMLPFAVTHMVRHGIVDLPQAWAMASLRPATLLGLPQAAGLEPDAPADLVTFDRVDGEISVREVFRDGRLVHRTEERP